MLIPQNYQHFWELLKSDFCSKGIYFQGTVPFQVIKTTTEQLQHRP